ncbi:hypothetical protein TNCV_2697031 [Trichonephila clavipes]|nr:hypothetical protein TNCV_2697031 [Trichonephila clavipes]
MQEINRKYPKTNSKLSGEYLRIFASTADERNEIIAFLKERDIDIKKDLSDRGFLVSKVAQLTKLKSKFKLPIFMVELQKPPDSPDIFKLDKCCFLTETTRWHHKLKSPCRPTQSPRQLQPPKEKRNQKEIESDDSGTFGFMDAIIELKKFFAEYPSLIELGKQLRSAQPHEKMDVFYRHIANQR